ncbi:hypothetical protein [Hymenobacter sp. PAMC 26628]|uniref:hypothetical protein n=1 Tax=Hymenobacter sp. PAMC 26628 TaxID=1484118 RepID=UPI0007700869|nr:hypothetical protein [Hymenobacter sp. PAMC 26628]AMJ65053.1 hypothetical protein AXW84_06130 [Hymenobacter sp. PAMC 26628]
MRHLSYTDLFRQAARAHVALRHSDTEMHFGRLILTGWPLTKLDIDEFLTATKSRIRLPILLLESYDARYQDNGADNIRKLCQAAFIVLDKPGSKDYDDRDATLDKCEEIGEDVLGYAIDYYRKKRLKLDPSTVSSEKVGPIGDGFWGTRFNFQLPEIANYPLAYQAAKFLP